MKRASLALMAVIFATSVEALPPRDASYFCEVEFSGGIAFDKSSGRWQSTTFIPSGKFVLKLKFLRSGIRKDFFDKDEPVNDYTVTITNAGENYASPCQQYGGEGTDGVSVGKWNTFRCTAVLQDYFFNLKANRFLAAYMVGYVDGQDNNSNTPAMSGGTCTKID